MTTESVQLKIDVEPEYHLLSGALQPYLYRSARGTLVVQGHMPYPAVYTYPPQNVFPGIPATAVSRDGGHSWELWKPAPDSGPPGQGLGPTIEGAVVQLSNGPTRIFEWIAEGPSPQGEYTGHFWDTTDEWRTVSGPTPCRIPLPQARTGHDDGGKPYSGVTFHRTVLELPNRDLLATVYCWFAEDTVPSAYEPKMNRFRCILLRSGDQGHTWRYVSTIAADATIGEEGFDEPAMVRLSGGPHAGRLVCVIRTGPRSDPLYQTHSDDEGQTWSAPRPLPLRGVDPDLVEMTAVPGATAAKPGETGILALSFGWRVLRDPPAPEHGNYVAFSTDQGESWGHATHLPIEPTSGATRSTCYTGLREVEPGKLLVTFDIGWWGTPVRYIGRRFVRVARVL